MADGILERFLSIFSTKVLKIFLGFLITPALVRVLGSAQYGDYAVMMSVLGIVMVFVEAGIFDGLRKYIAENRDILDWKDNVFGFYFRVSVGLVTVVTVLLVLFTYLGFVERIFEAKYELYFYVLCGVILSQQFSIVARSTLMGLGYERISEPLKVIRLVLFGVIGISLAYVGYGVIGVLLGRIVARVVMSVVAFVFVFRVVPLRSILQPIPSQFPRQELLSFNGMSIVLLFLVTSLYHVDVLMLQPLAGSQETGYYKGALVIAEFVVMLASTSVHTVLVHSTSELWSENKLEEITQLSSRVTRYTLLFTMLLAIGLAALADRFVPLYFGPDYSAAVVPLLLLLPGTVFLAVAHPIYAIGQGKGDLRALIYATGASAVLNFVLNLTLIPAYGMRGAAVATSIGYSSMLAFHVWSARKIGFQPLLDVRPVRVATTVLGSALVIFALERLISHDWVALALVPPIGLVVYVLVAVRLEAVGSAELTELAEKLPEPVNVIPRELAKRV